MKRSMLAVFLLLAGCGGADEKQSAEPSAASEDTRVYASGPRDRLCLKPGEQRAALITFAATSEANCTLKGSLDAGGTLRPDGDSSCTVTIGGTDPQLAIASASGCSYYCGPGATLEGRTFVRMDKAEPVTDIAGDPLC